MTQLYHILFSIFALLILSVQTIFAQPINTPRILENLSTTNGLSYNGVSDLLVDSRGYVWVATYDGLNLYNGISIKIYKRQLDNPILPSNRVRCLAEGSNGDIWIGTDNGVAIYDYDLDRFDIIVDEKLQQSHILRIKFSESSQNISYFICEDGAIFIYDSQSKKVEYVEYDNKVVFKELIVVDNGDLLIASSNGLIRFLESERRFQRVSADEVPYASTIAMSPDREIFIGIGKGLQRFDLETGRLYGEAILNNNVIRSIYFDSLGGLWIGVEYDGIKYVPNLDNKSSFISILEGHRTTIIRKTENNYLWVCSNRGAYKLDNGELYFQAIASSSDIDIFMPKVYALSSGEILIQSDLSMYTFDTSSHKIENKTLEYRDSTSENDYTIQVTEGDNIWQFSKEAIYLYDSKLKRSSQVKSPHFKKLPQGFPTWTEVDPFGNIWLGYAADLFKLTIGSDNSILNIESFKEHALMTDRELSRIRHIFYDELTTSLWMGTSEQGLYCLDLQKDKPLTDISFQVYRNIPGDTTSLTSNFVSVIHRTCKGELYVGTEQGGFCRVIETDSSALTFEGYTELDGLSNNVVKSMTSDQDGNLWIGTNIGLNHFDVKSQKIHIYRSNNDIPFDEFRYSVANDIDGRLFFTGNDEIIYFDPLALPMSEATPKLYFDDLSLGEQIVKPNEQYGWRTIIDSRLRDNDHIELRYNEMPFSISVDAISPQKSPQQYLYYILGSHNKEWTKLPITENIIRFNSLPPKDYTLRIKASNSFGQMSDEIKMNITILPPFYRSTLAYIIYAVFILIAIFISFYILMRFQGLRYKLHVEELRLRSIRELNSEKQRYFSGISHELKTPLSLIITPLTLMQQRFRLDEEVRKNLNSIQKQAKKMLQLIELAHGIQLGDENRLEMKSSTFYFDELILDITSDFEQLAKHEGKLLTIDHLNTEIEVCADYSMVEKVFTNIINNAFKYTKDGDRISIKYYAEDDKTLVVEILDTGRGISQDYLPHLFERYYTSAELDKNNSAGTGIGLAFSKMLIDMHNGAISVTSILNQQTLFVVKLPIVVNERAIPLTLLHHTSDIKEDVGGDNMILTDEFDNPIIVSDSISSSLIYVVDDNADMRIMLDDILRDYFNVVTFSSANALLDAMRSQWPNLVVSDVMMPEMSGNELCQVIKDDITTSHIPVVLLTALDTVDDKLKGYAQGADAYINKPFHPAYLIKRIEMLLQKSELLRERFSSSSPLRNEEVDSISSRDRKLIERLYELFEENIDNEDIELESFLDELGLSRSIFFTKIKALTKLSPYELLKKFRLEKAAELLLKGEYNVNEVCSMTGFKSRTHFSKLFKTTYGVTPSKYNKSE